MNAERTNIKRRSETFKAVTRIHGGSPVMTTLSGLVDTVTTKFSEKDLVKVTLYDENTDFISFYIFIDLYSGAGDLSIAASFFQKY